MIRNFRVESGGRLRGSIRVPGDKSVSHRTIMLGAIAEGDTHVSGFLEGADAMSTMRAFRALGVAIDGPDMGRVVVHGAGLHGLRGRAEPLDCGNAGTAMRLMIGLLAGQRFESTLIGDYSLSKRPMGRVADPLALMGARIETRGGCPPVRILPSQGLVGIRYPMPVASAQVKSALLLAGLYAEGQTEVIEPAPTRDHTERMLEGFGVRLARNGSSVSLEGGQRLRASAIDVPADISSAAFFLVGATISPGSELRLEHVGMNPTRTGVLEILRLMGAHIAVENPREAGGEPVADLIVRGARLRGIDVPPELVPLAIDELPALFIAAACAEGRTVVTGAGELRVKESDRIAVMAEGLRNLGIEVEPAPDGIAIEGRGNQAAVFSSAEILTHHDHRIAMSFALAGLRSSGTILIRDIAVVDTSFPDFVTLASRAGMAIEETGG